ncbi:MAG: efflux RND transporter permease subunit [Pseudomonadota bacterium]
MVITRQALSNPVAVVVAVLMVLLFGSISLFGLPIQMIPSVETPRIQIQTFWRAAAPEEVESEIIEPQEDAMRGLPGLKRMTSSASRGSANIDLTFDIDVEIDRALIEVMNRLNRVPSYPADVDEPIINIGQDENRSAIAWFAVRPLPGQAIDMAAQQDFVDDVIVTAIERVPGISSASAFGGRASEVRITFDPYKAAAYGIEIPALAATTGGNNDTSGGFNEVFRRQYTMRFAGKPSLEEFGELVLDWADGSPVRLRDIATVEKTLVDRSGILSQNGGPSIAFNAQPQTGVNVLEVMAGLKETVASLNDGVVGRRGMFIRQVYDETVYIESSIGMLRTNLLLGITLAVVILWWFMRKLRATVIVALAIPVSLFFAFTALQFSGRTLNIISLAGLAFAMGMVLDAAIVVLENIVRLREQGKSSAEAAHDGASQVWAALVASTATTVAIFLPILFLRDVAGQLFADLAFTLAVAVVTSLIIAITIIPTAATTWLRNVELTDPHASWWDRGSRTVMALTDTPRRRYFWIGTLVSLAVGLTVLLKPEADYLPEGQMNFAFGFILPPPGQSIDTAETEFVDVVNERMSRFLNGEADPPMQNYFLGLFGNFGFFGMRAEDPDDSDALIDAVNATVFADIPDTIAFAQRSSIFSRLGGGREIEVNIQSRDIEATFAAAGAGLGAIQQALPGSQVRPIPGLEFAEPELRMAPNDRRIAEVGWDRKDIASVVRALGDGLFVGDYFDGDKSYDIVLRGTDWETPETLAATPLMTPTAGVTALNEVVNIERTSGPSQIRRVDRRRSVTLSVSPPDISLEEALAVLQTEVDPVIRSQLPDDGEVTYYGSADELAIALSNMARSFALAVAILFLLMAALFRSFRDSLLVILALPLATVGGVVALRLTDALVFQPMDLMTMIGFITLLGLVVNNAILLVHQTRMSEREGMSRRDSVAQAVRLRLLPILMSTLTSLFGMLPLLLVPGPGTELYRGLAAVIVGGMTVSTVFTLILLPSLLRIGEARTAHDAAPTGSSTSGGPLRESYAERHSSL